MLLTIDIGNTNTNLCVFQNDEIIYSSKLSTSIEKTEDEYGIIILNLLHHAKLLDKVQGAIISSVVTQLDDIIVGAIEKYLKIPAHLINHKSKMPIEIKIDVPKELGADRIANAVATSELYKLPAIVIDFGTATTFDVIDKNKNFIGGLIAPGLSIQAKALSNFTSKLPKIKIEAPKKVISTGTIDAMMSGIVCGHAVMIEGMIELYEKELGERTTVIATGGLSNVVTDCMKRRFDIIDKDLTHKGLKFLYKENFKD